MPSEKVSLGLFKAGLLCFVAIIVFLVGGSNLINDNVTVFISVVVSLGILGVTLCSIACYNLTSKGGGLEHDNNDQYQEDNVELPSYIQDTPEAITQPPPAFTPIATVGPRFSLERPPTYKDNVNEEL